MLLTYNCILLKMSTWYSKHVEENIWRINNIKCITLVFLVWSVYFRLFYLLQLTRLTLQANWSGKDISIHKSQVAYVKTKNSKQHPVPIPADVRSKAWVCGRSPAELVGPCDGPITRLEESYRLWYVVVCDVETSRVRSWPAFGHIITGKQNTSSLVTSWTWHRSIYVRDPLITGRVKNGLLHENTIK